MLNTIPSLIENKKPPIVSYTYCNTNTIARLFNFKKCVDELDFETVTQHTTCKYADSNYKYDPIDHVLNW